MTQKEEKEEKIQVILLTIVALYFPIRALISFAFGI